MGRQGSNAGERLTRMTVRSSVRKGSVASRTKPSLAGRAAELEKDGETLTYKLLGGIDTFIYVVIERHRIFELRAAGKPWPWTSDDVFRRARFTNCFRILDSDTQYEIRVVIREGSPDFKECVFRLTLFRLFDRVETYKFLCETFGVPSWIGFDRAAYTAALDRRKAAGFSLVGHAYQMPSPTAQAIGGTTHHDRLLRLLELMMLSGFAEDMSDCYELCDMQAIIALYPTMGGFLGYQVILDLNMIPRLMLPEDWTLPGPGAQDGLRKIFGKSLKPAHVGLALQWVHEHFEELALATGYSKKDIPALRPSAPGLSLVDIEHMLCEFSKYVKIAAKNYRYRSFDLDVAKSKVTRDLPVNWKPTHVAVLERNRKYTTPGADKKGEYEPAAILEKDKIGRELHYKVRWKGWGPDADTWEPVAQLTEQTPDVVDVFERKMKRINDLLEKYRTGKM